MFCVFSAMFTILTHSQFWSSRFIQRCEKICRFTFRTNQCNSNYSTFFLCHNLGWIQIKYLNDVDDHNLALGRLEPPTSPLWEARSNLLSYRAIKFIQNTNRWGWDSNPRSLLQLDSLAVSWFQPLIHLTNHQFADWIYRITVVFQEKKYRRKCYFSLNMFQNFINYW